MQLRKIHTACQCPADCRQAAYVARVAERVYDHYDGHESRWALSDSQDIWKISLGGRAGVVGVHLEGRSCCVKLFYDRRLRTRLKVPLGLANAKRAYRSGLRLQELGIRSPKLIGYAEQSSGRLPLIVMEMVTEAMQLDHWIAQHTVGRPLIAALARFLRHMHDSGVTHRDLSPRNLLVASKRRGFNVWLLDWEDVRFRRTMPDQLRLADLHHLDERLLCDVSLRDRLRFLREYAGHKDSPWQDALGRMIEASRSKYVQRYRQHIVPSRGLL